MKVTPWRYSIAIMKLMRFDKPIGILLLLWPMLWALWIATQGHPSVKIAVVFIVGTIVMRALGCVINDIADRKFDRYVQRTQNRPLACGIISVKQALFVAIILAIAALLLVSMLNILTIKLAVVGLLLAILYPFCKRVTYLPQLVLGMAFSWSIIMVYAAVSDTVTTTAWWLYLAALLWPIAYDTIYAICDREDDLKIGVKSTAILFGDYDRLAIAIFQALFVGLLVLLGLQLAFHWPYYLCLFWVAMLMIYQQFKISGRDPILCLQAFKNNNYVGLLIWIGLFIHYSLY